MNIQIRIRTDTPFDDIIYIKDWLDLAQKGFAFQHPKFDNNHYHIYLFGIERNPDAMRKHLGKYLLDKTLYSVSTTAGKKRDKITPFGAYQYAGKPTALRRWIKGFCDADIENMEEQAKTYYAPKEPVEATLITRHDHYIVKPDRVWERLVEQGDRYVGKSVRQIKSMIAAQWINDGKAVPRPSDLHRYAISIFYRLKYFTEENNYQVPDWALENEYGT